MADQNFRSPLLMDDDARYLGNTTGDDDRGRLHVKISNKLDEILPLPDGASTSALQESGNAILDSIDTKVSTAALQQDQIGLLDSIDQKVATSANQTNGLQQTKIKGNFDGALIGNVSDRLKVDIAGQSSELLGPIVQSRNYHQIQIDFNTTADPNLITNTTSGGASVTISQGHTLYSTGTGATAEAKGVSVQKNLYRAASQIYSFFTASFTAPTSANSYQRIGLYDSSNGFFIGFNGLNFGITQRASGVDTFVSRASFSNDLLTGASGSLFTRNGLPEAIDLTKSNLFRIRFAWLGSAPVLFEVYSPDGSWVTFHTLKIPNSQIIPSIANPDLPMTIDVSKSLSDATNLVMTTACWAAGCTTDLAKITEALTDYSLASLTRSVITGRTTAGGSSYVNVKVSPSGAVQVGGTLDAVDTITNPLPVGTNTLGGVQIEGASSLARIGNVGDALKVSIASEIITAVVPTYTAAAVGVTAATNSTDIFLLRGSATRKVKIIDIQFSGLKGTTGYAIVRGVKRSTDNTGGTFTLPSIVSHESTDVASTALVRAYTANPTTLGTLIGPVYAFYSFLPSGNASGGGNIAGIDAIHGIGKPLILRGVNEVFAINMNGQAIAGLEYTITISWIEDDPL